LLATSPLCRALIPNIAASGTALGDALSRLLRDQCDELFGSTRDRAVHRVLIRTYFEPIGKQEVVAAELGQSFGTYRRHLASGTRRLVDALWSRYVRPFT
jgi:hypothetical protein